MKLHSLFTEIVIFSLIFLFFVVPPFLVSAGSVSSGTFSAWAFPARQLVNALALGTLFFVHEHAAPRTTRGRYYATYYLVFPAVFMLCLLFFTALMLRFLSVSVFSSPETIAVALPVSAAQWLSCLLNFFLAAFCEEVLYRHYLPQALLRFCGRLPFAPASRRLLKVLCEVLAAAAFAFAHRYGGIFSVINAALAHCILRAGYRLTGKPYAGLAAHFCYNIISLILL